MCSRALRLFRACVRRERSQSAGPSARRRARVEQGWDACNARCTVKKGKNDNKKSERIITEETSLKIRKILRKVVTDEKGTASLANIFGYEVSGKTGTSQYYDNKNKNINTFISFFSASDQKYILLVMLDDPKVAKNLIYDYRGLKIKATRNEAGWNAVYTSGKIIEKIGPILAINNKEILVKNVIKKTY